MHVITEIKDTQVVNVTSNILTDDNSENIHFQFKSDDISMVKCWLVTAQCSFVIRL